MQYLTSFATASFEFGIMFILVKKFLSESNLATLSILESFHKLNSVLGNDASIFVVDFSS